MKKLILFELKYTPAWNYIIIAITFGLLASTMALVGGFLSIPLLLGMNLFYSFTGTGIVKGITVIAVGAPWAAAILGLVFFLVGFAFWKWRMNLSLNRVDYHV